MSFYYQLPETEILDLRTVVLDFKFPIDNLFSTSSFSFQPFDFQIPIPQILDINFDKQQIILTVTSLWPLVRYRLEILDFFTAPQNIITFITPTEENKIRDRMIDRLSGNIYNLEGRTLIYDILDQDSHDLTLAKKDILEAKNQNYLRFSVIDEPHTRGVGPFDYLDQESAYHVLRVGKNPSGDFIPKKLLLASFPSEPITLQEIEKEEIISQKFEDLTLLLAENIIDLSSLEFIYSNGEKYIYSIKQYGFQIKNSRYSKYGKSFLTLKENELRLNDNILKDESFRVPTSSDKISIVYKSKNEGQEIDYSSVDVYELQQQVREVIAPIATQIDLRYGYIVSSNDEDIYIDGISFLNPNDPFGQHPAFLKEIAFDLSNLPSRPGQYSVDYITGRIFIYGAEINDGTGVYPPLVTYFHRFYFQNGLDYNIDQINNELAANSERDLIGREAKLSFSYASVLMPEQDYRSFVHSEILEERIENRLKSNRSLTVNNVPLTNVFRLYNETTGELYKIERWNWNTVYFSGNTDPKIEKIERERVSFLKIENETLNIFSRHSTQILSFKLNKEKISNATEDGLGVSFNSSAFFSKNDIFITERYFDSNLDLETNLQFLIQTGEYQIDYLSGNIYLFTELDNIDFGSVSYKSIIIHSSFSHLLTINDIYFSSSPSFKNKKIDYSSFTDSEIEIKEYFLSDEKFDSSGQSYIYSDNKITVKDNIFELRGVYDHYQLMNNNFALNFNSVVEYNENEITFISGLKQKSNHFIQVGLIITFPFYSPGIEVENVISVIRLSDGAELEGILQPNQTFLLSGTNSPIAGEEVEVIYTLILNGASNPVIDYSRGEFFVDYEYLADEILISYEFGPNCLDFSKNTTMFPGETYYVSYLVGALRDGLIRNFGSLVKIPILQSFDLTLSRERYRDALLAILQSFPKGISLESLKTAIKTITYVSPEIKEAAFLLWSLGESELYRSKVYHSGNLSLVPGKYDFGILFSSPLDYLELPASSHCSLECGTIEFWATPNWKGLDNLATLTAELYLNNNLISSDLIYLGAESINPTYDLDGKFIFSKSSALGLPGKIFTTEKGYFIYFAEEENCWKFLVKAPTSEVNKFSGKILTSGDFYSVQGIENLTEITDIIRTTNSKIDFQFFLDAEDYNSPDGYDGYDGYQEGYSFDGLQFCSDEQYYFFDIGNKNKLDENRMSLYRDGQGYLNFRILSCGPQRVEAKISTDVSNWKSQDSHFITASWKLNTDEQRDEIHLFLDGQEIPNILCYGGKPNATSEDRFRTILPEIVLGIINRPIIGGNDLILISGSDSVFSNTNNFSELGILPGDTLTILESGITYNILSVNQDTLVLDSVITSSLENVKYSINSVEFIVESAIHLFSNFIITRLDVDENETELYGLRSENPDYSLTRNLLQENILTILNKAEIGDKILVRTLGINFRTFKDQKYIWSLSSILKTQLPPPIHMDEVQIKKVLFSPTQCKISSSGVPPIFNATFSGFSDITNSIEGRQLTCFITGQNVNFSIPVTIILYGSDSGGPITETLEFTSAGKLNTINKFTVVNSFDISFLRWEEKEALVISFEEAYSVTESNGNNNYAVIKYTIPTINGTTLESLSLTEIKDDNQIFISSQVGEKIIISSPIAIAGTYEIISVIDEHTIEIFPALPNSFTLGIYQTYKILNARSGFQNGYFFFQKAGTFNEPFLLSQGFYKIEYQTYLSVPFNSLDGSEKIRIGSALNNKYSAQSVIDDFSILSSQLTDVRIGETDSGKNITSDYFAILPQENTSQTLLYLPCDSLPAFDLSENWIRKDKKYLQTTNSAGVNFNLAINLNFSPLQIENLGYLQGSQGTIEFWVSPEIDSFNDPKKRYYFDASSAITETVLSSTKTKLLLSSPASQVLDLKFGNKQNVPGNFSLSSDQKTIELDIPLPYQNIPITVRYFPLNIIGNRISIFKDETGYLVFQIVSGEKIFALRQPIFWERHSWHRIMAIYSCNKLENKDYLRLFIDGEERANLLFGTGIVFGTGSIFGTTNNISGGLKGNILFSDTINYLNFGSESDGQNSGFCAIDNIRLSNVARQPTIIAGTSKDLNYHSNSEFRFPVTEDLYTTIIFDFDFLTKKKDDLTLLKNRNYGLSNFEIQVIDSFDIVLSDEKVKKILETIIGLIKPAHSKVKISYIS